MPELGKFLTALGALLVVIGLLIWKGGLPLGRLPGDIYVQRPHVTFAFPLATCLLLSALLTLLLWLVRR